MPLPPLMILRGDECSAHDYVVGQKDVPDVRMITDEIAGELCEVFMREDGLGEGRKAWVSVHDLRGANDRGAKGEGGQEDREALVHGVWMFPALLIALDGGTWASASGVSVAAKECNDFLTSLTREEQRKPYEWVWLEMGDTVPSWCNRMRPGNKAMLSAAMMGLRKKDAPALAKMTRSKTRVAKDTGSAPPAPDPPAPDPPAPDPQPAADPPRPGVFRPSPEQEAAAREQRENLARAHINASDSTCDTQWEDDDLNLMDPPFDPATYVGPVHTLANEGWAPGDDGPPSRYGIEIPLRARHLGPAPGSAVEVGGWARLA
jgi:hypothetical protein